jgi:FKBP-type peptidyl-prolyl cis-trans isomerase SlyD
MKVGKNMKVSMAYKLYVDGEMVDESGEMPFTFIYGYSQVIPGVEKNLEGMGANEAKSFTVVPEEGYGERREDLIQRIPAERFPENAQVEIGQVFEVTDANGRTLQFVISSIEDNEVIADFNHPLAGKELKFDVTVTNVEQASEQEISQLLGFATSCGPNGCDSCSGC